MSERPSLDNYIDVAERIVAFNEKWPEGTLQTIGWHIEQVGDRSFVVYRAAAYRTPTDERPGHGTAWEPFPGLTPYTKNSELMNAETAAWGRAIVACGIVANRKLASKQEVRARQEEQAAEQANGNGSPQPTAAPVQQTERIVSAKQRGMLNAKAAEIELAPSDFANLILTVNGQPARDFDSQEDAQKWLGRAMDRFPASKVNALLEEFARIKNDLPV